MITELMSCCYGNMSNLCHDVKEIRETNQCHAVRETRDTCVMVCSDTRDVSFLFQ